MLAVPVALAARLLSLLPALVLRVGSTHKTSALVILTWAGLRGGIAVALVLSMPYSPYRDRILAACYAIVAFSIVIQGLTLDRITRVIFPGPP